MSRVRHLVLDNLGRLEQFAHASLSENLIFVSGTLGTLSGLELVPGGVRTETQQTLENIARILDAAGSSWADVVKVNAYLSDPADFADMNDVYGSYFDDLPPARMTVAGVTLALGARVEIECVAERRPATSPWGPSGVPRRRTGFVDRDGERLYFEVVGEGGTPLVLSHGAGGNHATWFQQVAYFARDRAVITWDHRGYGRSSDLGDRSGPQVASDDLLAILDSMGVARADFVGQSMGGWSVVGAALARPGLVRRLVLADSLGGFLTDATTAALARVPKGATVVTDEIGSHPALGSRFIDERPDLAHLYQSLGQMGTADASVIIARLLATRYGPDEAAQLTMPVLCIVGDRDQLFTPASIRALCDLLPDARVVEMLGCGHSPYFEDPTAWNVEVARFLNAPE